MDELKKNLIEAKKDLDKSTELKEFYNSKGGQRMARSLEDNISSLLVELADGYATVEETEMRAKLANISSSLGLLKAFYKSSSNANFAEGEVKYILQLMGKDEEEEEDSE